LVRANNEDSVYAGARLLALADGMGGHAAGEVASQLVIAALAHLDDDEPGGDLLSKLDAAVREGNSAIAAHVEADPELEGMGTTLTAILFAATGLGWCTSATPAAIYFATANSARSPRTTRSSRRSSTKVASLPRRRTAIRSAR
jgi:Serine/threonine protein phosphatase